LGTILCGVVVVVVEVDASKQGNITSGS
jgi:hypothetical protein